MSLSSSDHLFSVQSKPGRRRINELSCSMSSFGQRTDVNNQSFVQAQLRFYKSQHGGRHPEWQIKHAYETLVCSSSPSEMICCCLWLNINCQLCQTQICVHLPPPVLVSSSIHHGLFSVFTMKSVSVSQTLWFWGFGHFFIAFILVSWWWVV